MIIGELDHGRVKSTPYSGTLVEDLRSYYHLEMDRVSRMIKVMYDIIALRIIIFAPYAYTKAGEIEKNTCH